MDNLKGKPLDYKESAAATPTSAGPTLADSKANAQAAGHGIEVGYAAHTDDDFPKAKDGFYVIYKNNHDYDNIMVFELSSAADAKKYADAVQKTIESAKVRYYDRFVVEIAIVDKAVRPTFTDDMAKGVMNDLFKNEGTAAQGTAATEPTKPISAPQIPKRELEEGEFLDAELAGIQWYRGESPVTWTDHTGKKQTTAGGRLYVFNEDGTFLYILASILNRMGNGFIFKTGNYTAKDGVIYCTNVKTSWIDINDYQTADDESFYDREDSDFVMMYYFFYWDEDDQLSGNYRVAINDSGSILGSFDPDGTFYHYKRETDHHLTPLLEYKD